jgi:general stress protein YciG
MKKHGFQNMTPERQLELARMGGRAVPNHKRSFSQNRELAREAGRKGGKAVAAEKRAFSLNSTLAAEAGRKGGSSKGLKESGDLE